MQIKIPFWVVATYKQGHKIHYGCIDNEERSAAFDLSNRTDGESVSDYPLLRGLERLQGAGLVVYCHSGCCQMSALPFFTHLKTTNPTFETFANLHLMVKSARGGPLQYVAMVGLQLTSRGLSCFAWRARLPRIGFRGAVQL